MGLLKNIVTALVLLASVSAYAQPDIVSAVLSTKEPVSAQPNKPKSDSQQNWRLRTRHWISGDQDSGSVHVMGNGRLTAFGRGADLVSLHAAPMSSPSLLSLTTKCSTPLQDDALRIDGSAMWSHELTDGKSTLCKYTEFVGNEFPAYVRVFECAREGVQWQVKIPEGGKVTQLTRIENSWLITIPAGQKMANGYTSQPSYAWLIPNGNCLIQLNQDGDCIITPKNGTGALAIVADSDYPNGVQSAERLAADSVSPLISTTSRYWEQFTKQRLSRINTAAIDKDVLSVLDNAAVTMKCMQGDDGGIASSEKWMMADTRQQYSVMRAMLLLGMTDEARRSVMFRVNKFNRFQDIKSAESINTDGFRWRHENDDADITAATILQIRDYYRSTQDRELARTAWPLMKYCWDAQIKQIAQGQIPFSGDEPIVTNGFYPRTGLMQGSSDAIIMFVEAGKWLCDWAVREGFWTPAKASQNSAIIEQCRIQWRLYMLSSDVVYANSSEREANLTAPNFRWGACDADCGYTGWCERAGNGLYLCPECIQKQLPPASRPGRLEIVPCSLLPIYIGSDVLTKDDTVKIFDHLMASRLPSGQMLTGGIGQGSLNADAGLLLLNLTLTGDARASEAFTQMMSQMDTSRNWSELITKEGKPAVTSARCSSWSTAVCAEALWRYIKAHTN